MHTIRRSAGLVALVVLVAACSGASAPTGTLIPSIDPNTPVTDAPGGGGSDPGVGDGLVVPKPGQLDVHPVSIDLFETRVDGRAVSVIASWTSGVEPCYVLDSVVVDRDGQTFSITVREGHGPEDVACIEIAQMKRVAIDLGELEPGTYTIVDSQGSAAPVEIVVT